MRTQFPEPMPKTVESTVDDDPILEAQRLLSRWSSKIGVQVPVFDDDLFGLLSGGTVDCGLMHSYRPFECH